MFCVMKSAILEHLWSVTRSLMDKLLAVASISPHAGDFEVFEGYSVVFLRSCQWFLRLLIVPSTLLFLTVTFPDPLDVK